MATRVVTEIMPYTEEPVAGPWDGHSGNYDESRLPIDRIIIHTMVGTAEGAAARFNNPASEVSAHYGVKLDGSLIHWLEETFTAYHSGDYLVNQSSIGIEHEDNWNGQPPEPTRTDALYVTSAKLVADICKFYSIPCDRSHIRKHSEVSDHPTACPDALDIDRIVHEASLLLVPAIPPQPPVITDQTKIPLGKIGDIDYGSPELQAVRSKILEKDRANANLTSVNNQQVQLIVGLRDDLQKCQTNPPNGSFSPKTSLGKFFYSLARSSG